MTKTLIYNYICTREKNELKRLLESQLNDQRNGAMEYIAFKLWGVFQIFKARIVLSELRKAEKQRLWRLANPIVESRVMT